jgi:hypothetical protein
MFRAALAALSIVFSVVLVLFLTGVVDPVRAQTSTSPRVFQTEVVSWLGDPSTDTTNWTFTYMNDGSLHVATGQREACPSIAVPSGVFVAFITSSLETASQPGNDQPLEICEAFFTRANG